MIPKIIHYCWFGGNPLPESAKKYIASWRKFLPDYEIKEWNENNFDVNIIPYTSEAYKAKKFAFVSDYARFYILYKYGGLYFDTDVEVIRNMDDIIARGPFMGRESNLKRIGPDKKGGVNPGLGLGVSASLPIIKELLDSYLHNHMFTWLGKPCGGTIVNRTSKILSNYNGHVLDNDADIEVAADVSIYPPDYFCPKDYNTGDLHITDNTRSIHHYSATWVKNTETVKDKIKKRLFFMYSRFYSSVIIKHKYTNK